MHKKINELMEKKIPFSLCTVVWTEGSTPSRVGMKMIVKDEDDIEGTIGGGSIEKNVIKKAVEYLKEGKKGKERFTLSDIDMKCGGDVEVFIESFVSLPRIVIAGAGHIGRELLNILRSNEQFIVKAFDNRKENAQQLSTEFDVDYLEDFNGLENCLKKDDYLVVLTHGHEFDYKVVKAGCDFKYLKYLGCIGSRHKVKDMLNRLIKEGIDKNLVDNVNTPIGLKIGGDSPFEIAISILAEIISIKNSEETGCSMKI